MTTRSGRKVSVTSYKEFSSGTESSPEKTIRKSLPNTRSNNTNRNICTPKKVKHFLSNIDDSDSDIENNLISPPKRKFYNGNCSDDSDDSLFKKKTLSENHNLTLRRTRLSNKVNNIDSDIENKLISPPKRRLYNDNCSDDSDDNLFKTPVKKKMVTRNSNLTPKIARKLDEITVDLEPLTITTPRKTKHISKLNLDTPTKSILKTPNSVKTPSSKRVSLVIDLKMTIKNNKKQNYSDLDIIRKKLHVSAVPDSLPCRENEYSDIYNFIYGKLSSDSSGCMYVAGVPGTGKTATVTEVIKNLEELSKIDNTEIPEFSFVHINGMRLTEPRQAYVQIYKQLTDKTLVWDQAYNCIEKQILINNSKKRPIVLLMDELDIIHTKRQDVVYNILNWPSKTNSKLIIIAISNTMDLPERLLMGRVASRLGLTRLPFQPYTFKQLEQIVATRLEGIDVFQAEAIQLVARKVAAVSGDARRALDICRRAAEIASLENANNSHSKRVTLKHVNEALSEMINSDQIKLIRSLSKVQQLFLQAIIAEVTRIGVEETSYQNVLQQFQTLAALNGVIMPSFTVLLTTAQYLAKQKLIVIEKSKFNVIEQLYLNISQDDVQFALNQLE